jgi:hypothetical protein
VVPLPKAEFEARGGLAGNGPLTVARQTEKIEGVSQPPGAKQMIVRDPTDHPYVFALAVAVVLIVAVLIVSIAWPDMLPWAQKARVVSR